MLVNKNRVFITILLVTLFFTSSMVLKGYSYFDTTNEFAPESIPMGTWTYVPLPVGLDFTQDLSDFMDTEIGLDPESDYQ